MRKPITVFDDRSRERALELIRALNPAKKWDVTIALHSEKRTREQSNTMHMAFSDIASATGNTPQAVKDAMVDMFLFPVTIKLGGETRYVARSTTTLNVQEMSDFMSHIYAWAASEGIAIRHPEDLGR